MLRSISLALALLLTGVHPPALADPAMASLTLRLTDDAGAATEVTALLHRPDEAGKRPAIILLPDGTAPDTRADVLAEFLSEAGWTVLSVDLDPLPADGYRSTGPALLAPGSDPRRAVPVLHQILAILAADPLVNPNRIAAVGLGPGGRAALLAAMEAPAEEENGPDGLRFAAHAALYPGCRALLEEGFARYDSWNLAPTALLNAGRDDRDGPGDCDALHQALLVAGRPPALWQVYPGATYGWDYGDVLGRIIRLPRPGAAPITVYQDAEVAADAAERLIRFLRAVLEAPPAHRTAGR